MAEENVDAADENEGTAAPAMAEASVDGSLWEGPGGPLAGMAVAVVIAGGVAAISRLRKRR